MGSAGGAGGHAGPAIGSARTSVFTVPTDGPESDGTLTWSSTTCVVVEVTAGGRTGLGYSYADARAAPLAAELFAHVVRGRDAMAVGATRTAMLDAVRNIGRPGLASTAIAAIDVALWDLKARLLGLPLVTLLGREHDDVPIYGSGGFTSQTIPELTAQLGGWVEAGIPRVKMKVGRDPDADPGRVEAARLAIGDAVLMVDANGAYAPRQAIRLAERFAGAGVTWFEEPVTSDDADGLRFVRDRAPAGMAVAAGEYAWDLSGFQRLLRAGAVDTLQADLTRCGGITGFLEAATLAEAWHVPLSAHTAPALHVHAGAAARPLVHIEYFHDHVRVEQRLFDGVARPVGGRLAPPADAPGHGLTLKRADAEEFAQ